MLDIYLCEDNETQLMSWKKKVANFLLMMQKECILRCAATNPNDLLAIRKESVNVGLYFLDIDLQASINGLELAQKLRNLDPRGYIVFVTTHSEMAQITFRYKVEAMDFILKDDPASFTSRFCECIDFAVTNHSMQLQNASHSLTIKSNGISSVIDQNDIIYIQTSEISRKVIIHMVHGIRQTNGSIKELIQYLNPTFFQCGKSVVINLIHIKEFQMNTNLLLLDNNDTVQVSFRMAGKLNKLLKNR